MKTRVGWKGTRESMVWGLLRPEPELEKRVETIYTNFGDRGGPLFRGKTTPKVEGSESPNRRMKTRGQKLVGRGGDYISKIWKIE